MEHVVYNFSIRSTSVKAIVNFHFNLKPIPEGVLGWKSELPKRYHWVFIVPNEDIFLTHKQCNEMELRNFIILGTKDSVHSGNH
jgi:hypothetical protein